jgi:hypothetical protein
MTAIEQRGSELPDNLPMLTHVVGDELLDELPTLTEIVEKIHHTALPAALNETDIRQVLQRLETHLEIVFTQKLNHQLEQLQRQAIERAVSELKAELPELLRNALNSHPGL